MDDEAIDRVVAALEDDAFRRGGSITHDRLLALASKSKLSAEAIVAVKQRLIARDIEIEGTDQQESAAEVSDASESTGVLAGLVEDDEEPPAEALAEVRDILTAFYHDAFKFKLLTAAISLCRRCYPRRACGRRGTRYCSSSRGANRPSPAIR